MTNEERLNHRARQILDDPTLPLRERVPNSSALLKQLALSVQDRPDMLDMMLNEISDETVRELMRVAIAAEHAV